MYQPMPAPGQATAHANRTVNALLLIGLVVALVLAVSGTVVNTVGVTSLRAVLQIMGTVRAAAAALKLRSKGARADTS
jgi:small neutral amino acid transporter SnatA (MarC family)